jgi:hypothetical protein
MNRSDEGEPAMALVPLEPDGWTGCGPRYGARPLAGFVVQLLASVDRLPAYRAKRRAEPAVATASYGAGDGHSPCGRFVRVL